MEAMIWTFTVRGAEESELVAVWMSHNEVQLFRRPNPTFRLCGCVCVCVHVCVFACACVCVCVSVLSKRNWLKYVLLR